MFVLVILLSERQAGEALGPSNKASLFRMSDNIEPKSSFTLLQALRAQFLTNCVLTIGVQ
jgi:hypothetical protein